MVFSSGPAGDLEIRDLTASLDSTDLARSVAVSLKTDTRTDGAPGLIRMEGVVEDLFDEAGKFRPGRAKSNLQADLKKFRRPLSAK